MVNIYYLRQAHVNITSKTILSIQAETSLSSRDAGTQREVPACLSPPITNRGNQNSVTIELDA